MKRDMNMIRFVLLEAENDGAIRDDLQEIESELKAEYGDDYAQIRACHIELLSDSGLVSANVKTIGQGKKIFGIINKITWSGYEYLDSVRDREVWRQTKNIFKRFGSASLPVIQKIAADVMIKLIKD